MSWGDLSKDAYLSTINLGIICVEMLTLNYVFNLVGYLFIELSYFRCIEAVQKKNPQE